MPPPRAKLAVRAGRAFRRDPLRFMRALDGDGGTVRFRAGLTDFTLLRNPDTIHRVLVADNDLYGEGKWTHRGERVMHECLITLEGSPHRTRRLALQPAFDRRRVEEHGNAIVAAALRVGERWHDGRTIEARGEMSRVALAVVGEALLAIDLEPDTEAHVEALLAMLYAIPRGPLSWRAARRLRYARRLLGATAARAIAAPGGPLQATLTGLDERVVRDEIVSMLIAGVDTTPGTLAWTWFLLGRNPEVEARVHAELDGLLGGRAPTAADLPRLRYLRLVLDETLRLYPPVHFIDRRPLVDVELDGARVGAGSYLLISPLLTQRDPRFFGDADEFRPERWANGAARSRAYFPFGAGPHTCIGMALARTEILLVVAALASRWRLRPAPELPERPSPQTARFPMRVEAR